jgi:transcriptional regulator with XRE-family HTH domain
MDRSNLEAQSMTHILTALAEIRKDRRLSQEKLAELCTERFKSINISAKSIYRYESGRPCKNQARVKALASVLEVTPNELYGDRPFEPEGNSVGFGFRAEQVLFSPTDLLNYDAVSVTYGVTKQELISAAPWMFAILAEMSLRDRKDALAAAMSAFTAAVQSLPKHLVHASEADTPFDAAVSDEEWSIAQEDVFGWALGSRAASRTGIEPFDCDATNPFIEFLKQRVSELETPNLNPRDCEIRPDAIGMPRWHLYRRLEERSADTDVLEEHARRESQLSPKDLPEDVMWHSDNERAKAVVSTLFKSGAGTESGPSQGDSGSEGGSDGQS